MSKLSHAFIILLISLTVSACSDNGQSQQSAPSTDPKGVDTTSTVTKGWALFAVNTVTSGTATSQINHNDYLTGSHSSFKCNDCHSITQTDPATNLTTYLPREKICVYCHPLSKYASVMTDADHTALNSGTRCNACHYSASGVAGSGVIGWRWSSNAPRIRVPSSLWHKDIKGACLNCHITSAVAKYPAGHYATGCESCHTYGTGSWGPGTGHAAVTSACSTCHPAKSHTIAGSTITSGSMFAGVDCSTCHQSSVTAGFANWLGAPGAGFHSGITGACTNCHAPSTIPAYPAGHYTSGCEKCHGYNNGSWKSSAGHTAVTSGCLTCHSAHSHTLAGTSIIAGTVFAGSDCSTCHQPSVTVGFTNWLGAPGGGFHSGITGACTNCHTPSTIPAYPAGHYTTGCESCHGYNNGSWKSSAGHAAVTSACSTCHPAKAHTIAASSITAGTMFAGVDCSTCHQPSVVTGYVNWLGAPGGGFHTGITGACTTCHTPSSTPAYPAGHSTSGCETCHTYNNGSWKTNHPAATTCASCHPAKAHTIAASSITVGTMFSGVDCSTCHQPSVTASYANWLGAPGGGFHTNITGACTDCHTPTSVVKFPAGHNATACETCHTYNNGSWKTNHPAATTGCNATGCHATHTHTTVVSATLLSPETFTGIGCENCHSASITAGYANWLGATHETSPAACTTCHVTHSHTTLVGNPIITIAKGSALNYFSGIGCEKCHAASAPAYTSWLGAGAGALHISPPPNCQTCHQHHNNTKLCTNCHSSSLVKWNQP